MLVCWSDQSKERPTFKELRAKFDAMLLAERNDTYIALCIDENKSYYQQSLTPVPTRNEIGASSTSLNTEKKSKHSHKDCSVTDRNLSTRNLAYFRQSSLSLDEVHAVDRRTELSDRGNRPARLSLQVFTDDQFESRYVESPMKGQLVVAYPPAVNSESKEEIEMAENVQHNNPRIEVSDMEHQVSYSHH